MKMKQILVIALIALASITMLGTTRAEAQCCYGDWLAAPFVAAGAIVGGAVMASAAIVSAPFTALSCGTCGVPSCNPCGVTYVPPCNPCSGVTYVPPCNNC